ncbi:MAG: hypothetical protein CW338_01080 [Clostridiales bacterium]|nr:hypothetical protein [Clostridiales bacterium]
MHCAFCGKEGAGFSQDCLIVEYNNSFEWDPEDGAMMLADHSYQFIGKTAAVSLCPDCLRKQMKKKRCRLMADDAHGKFTYGGVMPVILLWVLLLGVDGFYETSVAFRIILSAVCILLTLALIHTPLIVTTVRMRRRPGVAVAGKMIRDDFSKYSILVPVGDGYYKDARGFNSANCDLPQGFNDMLYEKLIENGKWKELVRH